ncbi:T9SS type B sorting domain-containing protein [Flavisericum labens]|uniref:T9SS type B sorting domain-containing protein n=1 Tax=Flavisericum labens TaxID=3377112 RepID=UPI00387A9E3B
MPKSIIPITLIFFFVNHLYTQNLIFSKSAGSDSIDSHLDQGYDIVSDTSGNIYVTGIMSKGSTGAVFGQGEANQTNLNINGAFIAKYDNNGLLLWTKQIGANNNGVVSNAITLGTNNNIYITGYYNSEVTFGIGTTTQTTFQSYAASRDIFFAKYSQDGDFIWAKSFGGLNDDAPGGRDIYVDSNQNIYITGAFNGNVVFGAGETNGTALSGNRLDMFLSKYDANGDLIWVQKAGGDKGDRGENLDLDSSGNIYITGNFFDDITFAESEPNEIKLIRHNVQAFIAKYDTNGQFIWAKSPYYYSDDTSNVSGDIKVLNDNRIVYTGAYGTYGNTYLTNCIELEGEDQYDAILIQFDSNGNYIWNTTINSAGGDRGLALDVDQIGNSYVTGYFYNETLLNENLCNETQLNNKGLADIFICIYDINGQLLSIETAGGNNWDQASAIDVDNSGNIYITGYYDDNIIFGETQLTETTLVKNGTHEIYVAKYHIDLNNISKKPYAGEGTCLEICENSSSIDLFNQLLNNPDPGGIWIPNLSSGTNIFDPTTDGENTYRYTVYNSGCMSDYTEITISFIEQQSAGEDTSINLCIDNAPINLFEQIGGSPVPGGTWSPVLSSGTGIFNPVVDAPGIYTYTVTGEAGCSFASSEVNVVVDKIPNAGEGASLELCLNNSSIDLFDSLTGSPDEGGIWTPKLTSGTSTFDPSIDSSGIYTYTVSNGICDSDTSEVKITINMLPNAGEDGSLEICVNSSPINLFDRLEGTPDLGGFWMPSLVSGTGVFNPLVDSEGIYTYTVSNGLCSSDTSKVLVTKTSVTPISDYEININEFNSNNSIEIIINSNLEYEFSIDGINYQNSNVFNNLIGGDYTLYVQEINGCGTLETVISILDYPKFFTPNNDGVNDTWKLHGATNKNYSVYVYDRYGKLLKHLTTPEIDWDGTFNGVQLPTNDYWFKAVFTDGFIKSGHFTLKR